MRSWLGTRKLSLGERPLKAKIRLAALRGGKQVLKGKVKFQKETLHTRFLGQT